jgi:hypothetical protein
MSIALKPKRGHERRFGRTRRHPRAASAKGAITRRWTGSSPAGTALHTTVGSVITATRYDCAARFCRQLVPTAATCRWRVTRLALSSLRLRCSASSRAGLRVWSDLLQYGAQHSRMCVRNTEVGRPRSGEGQRWPGDHHPTSADGARPCQRGRQRGRQVLLQRRGVW